MRPDSNSPRISSRGQRRGPWLFGLLIDTGSRWSVLGGYLIGAVLMLAAAVIAARWGVGAERKPAEVMRRPSAAAD